MNFKQFFETAKTLPQDITVLIRGNHGIGKSQAVRQLADHFQLPVAEQRLGQMFDGDLIGVLDKSDEVIAGRQSSDFLPPKWMLQCVEEPHLIFLDEINRGSVELMQAAFQLVLDREVAGVKIHPDCRIYAAINASPEYQVNEMDPALQDRFYIVDLKPTVQDWLVWAKENLDDSISDFIAENPKHLEDFGGDGMQVLPSRRSWERYNKALRQNNLFSSPTNPLFYSFGLGLVGPEATISYVDYVKNRDRDIKIQDVLDNYNEALQQRIANATVNQVNALIDKIGDHSKENIWTQDQADNISSFAKSLSGESAVAVWHKVTGSRYENARKVHTTLEAHLLGLMGAVNNNDKQETKSW